MQSFDQWSDDLARSRGKQKSSYLYYKSVYGNQTWHNDSFPWWALTYNVAWPFYHMALWDTRFTYRRRFSTKTLKSSPTSCYSLYLKRQKCVWKNLFQGEPKKFKKNYELISYAMLFGHRNFFSIIKLVFQGKREFYLFHYTAIFKDCVLFKET